jgi:hypothetical protein
MQRHVHASAALRHGTLPPPRPSSTHGLRPLFFLAPSGLKNHAAGAPQREYRLISYLFPSSSVAVDVSPRRPSPWRRCRASSIQPRLYYRCSPELDHIVSHFPAPCILT